MSPAPCLEAMPRSLVFALALLAGCQPELRPADLEGLWRIRGVETVQPFSAAEFRGDSPRFPMGIAGDWLPFALDGDSLRTGGHPALGLRLDGDSLWLDAPNGWRNPELGPWRIHLVRLGIAPEAPRPDRIGLSMGGCYGFCPSFDLEVDRDGTVAYVSRYDRTGREGSFEGRLAPGAYDRLSALAAVARADTARHIPRIEDGSYAALVLWYGSGPRTHRGDAILFNDLALLLSELYRLTEQTALHPAPDTHVFASREALHLYEGPDLDEAALQALEPLPPPRPPEWPPPVSPPSQPGTPRRGP